MFNVDTRCKLASLHKQNTSMDEIDLDGWRNVLQRSRQEHDSEDHATTADSLRKSLSKLKEEA
jgi:hypothetical protein